MLWMSLGFLFKVNLQQKRTKNMFSKFSSVLVALVFSLAIGVNTASAVKTLTNDAVGGECSSIGVWDDLTKTCTMTADTFEQINLPITTADGVTLDCDGFTIDKVSHVGHGVFLGANNATVKNCNIINYFNGVSVVTNDGSSVLNNHFQFGAPFGGGNAVRIQQNATNTVVSGNLLTDDSTGIALVFGNGGGIVISGNTLQDTPLNSQNHISCANGVPNLEVSGNLMVNVHTGVAIGEACNNVLVKNNTLDGITTIGIQIAHPNGNDGVVVKNNKVMNASGQAAINVAGNLTNVTVVGNDVLDSAVGVSVGNGIVGVTVERNNLTRCGRGLNVFGTDPNTLISKNKIKDSTVFGIEVHTISATYDKNTICDSSTFDIDNNFLTNVWTKNRCTTIDGIPNAACSKVCK
jgi:hypothetical protein